MLPYLEHTPSTPETNIYEIVIEGDENDGDYIIEITYCTPEGFSKYLTLLMYIKEGRLTGTGDCSDRNSVELTDREEDLLWDIVPSRDYGVHSLEISSITYTDNDSVIYDVTLDPVKIRKEHPELFI